MKEVKVMAGRGRPPKPTAVKELEGNPGKRALNKNEPKPKQIAPKCPSWLEPDAKKEWRRLSKELEAMGLLTQVDMAAFAGYCQAYARWKEAEEFISKHGSILKTASGYIQQIPQVSIAQQNLKQMRNFCSELGLSPSARSRLNINNSGNTIEGDAMEELLSNVPKAEDILKKSKDH
jgi:P27 family predicted phage terminase small subunit